MKRIIQGEEYRITKSANKTAYIMYRTGARIRLKKEHNIYYFAFRNNKEIEKLCKEYDNCILNNNAMYVNLTSYMRYFKILKRLIKDYKMEREQGEIQC